MTKTVAPKPGALLSSRTVVWLVLALPGLLLVWPLLFEGRVPSRLLNGSGEWAARFFILTLALTPLQRLLPRSRLVFWLMRRRRYFGVASFGYAAFHVGWYVGETIVDWGPGALTWMLFTAVNLFAWTGWVAIAAMLPPALTSNDLSRRRLGRWWKWVQRLSYLAAAGAAVHWLLLAGDWLTWTQVGALAALELARIGLALARRAGIGGGDRQRRVA